MAQLSELLVLILEVSSSNPVISRACFTIEKTEIKKKRPGMAIFKEWYSNWAVLMVNSDKLSLNPTEVYSFLSKKRLRRMKI